MAKKIEYEAIIKINDEVVGKISAFSMEALEEKLYKLERIEESIEDENEDTN